MMCPLPTLEATGHVSLLRTRSVVGVTKDLLILKLLDIQVANAVTLDHRARCCLLPVGYVITVGQAGVRYGHPSALALV